MSQNSTATRLTPYLPPRPCKDRQETREACCLSPSVVDRSSPFLPQWLAPTMCVLPSAADRSAPFLPPWRQGCVAVAPWVIWVKVCKRSLLRQIFFLDIVNWLLSVLATPREVSLPFTSSSFHTVCRTNRLVSRRPRFTATMVILTLVWTIF